MEKEGSHSPKETVGAAPNGTSVDVNDRHCISRAMNELHSFGKKTNGEIDTFLFTSESVGEGHPDKMCDQVSDSVLDAYLKQDPQAKVACESVTKTGLVLVCGEITSTAVVDVAQVVRDTVRGIGYDGTRKGFDANTCSVLCQLEHQSPEIAEGVHLHRDDENLGAGDQGLMFGYATDETDCGMPLTIILAQEINVKLSEMRRNGELPWALPDSKSQVTCEYTSDNGACIPIRVHTVVVSIQHTKEVDLETVRKDVKEKVILKVIPEKYIDKKTIFHINPCGPFTTGGPDSDAGLTGRKIIVDTYGGWGAHGGGAFSGKDPTKVDRSAAYAARWVAKNLVKAGLCRRCLVQISYAIGIAEPLSITVFHYGTSDLSHDELLQVVNLNFDLRPGMIIKNLDLRRPIYKETSKYGHFGHEKFPWEKCKTLKLPVALEKRQFLVNPTRHSDGQ